ncbi:MAG: HD domain-containing protein [Nitrososphaerota archaeon]|nr:HD domain-containing protein [Nitrososphaerota archaeon]
MSSFACKVFRDNVHGYIRVPEDVVQLFINTEIFQRLRNIEQTGMRILYPSARHDRFIHSLGTFHLGSKAFESFRKNAKEASDKQTEKDRRHYYVSATNDDTELFWDKCGALFEIACLLHDCGHAPFSHTLENLYAHPSISRPLINELLNKVSRIKTDFMKQGKPGAEHEHMSALVVCSEYVEKIQQFLANRKLNTVDIDRGISGNTIAKDLEFIVRMIIGCTYSDSSEQNIIKNCFISLLNSTSIDVDSLDYIVRDSKLSGIDNMSVDVERLLSSLTLVEKTKFDNARVQNAQINTNLLNVSLKNMDGNIPAEIMGQYRGKAEFKNVRGKLTGAISASGTVKINSKTEFIDAKNNILKVGSADHTISHTLDPISNHVPVELFGVTTGSLQIDGPTLNLNKGYDGNIECSADEIEVGSAFVNGTITGTLTGELLGYCDVAGGIHVCELGFHKSSLGVIQNVLIARNYEYQWIYAHHKVVYYSNYLIIDLFQKCIEFWLSHNKLSDTYEDICAKIMSWENMIKHTDGTYHQCEFAGINFFRPVDGDIYALFKKCKAICMNEKIQNQVNHLLTEYFTRNYKTSLWKSYAEYNIFFSFLSDIEKRNLEKLLFTKSTKPDFTQYGYFEKEWADKLKTFGLQNVVWVNTNSKLKALNPDNTCILFNETTLNYRTVTLSQDIPDPQKMEFFYLFYEKSSGHNVNVDGLKRFIRDELRKFPTK